MNGISDESLVQMAQRICISEQHVPVGPVRASDLYLAPVTTRAIVEINYPCEMVYTRRRPKFRVANAFPLYAEIPMIVPVVWQAGMKLIVRVVKLHEGFFTDIRYPLFRIQSNYKVVLVAVDSI